jgi:hypothetical protein
LFLLGVLAFGEGDAAGEGLVAGLGLVAGALSPALPGEGDVDGDAFAVGMLELLSGSVVQPDANRNKNVDRSSSAVRLIVFGVVISFLPRSARLKSGTMIARAPISSNGCSHRSFKGISARYAPKPSLIESACTISERGECPTNFRMSDQVEASTL